MAASSFSRHQDILTRRLTFYEQRLHNFNTFRRVYCGEIAGKVINIVCALHLRTKPHQVSRTTREVKVTYKTPDAQFIALSYCRFLGANTSELIILLEILLLSDFPPNQ